MSTCIFISYVMFTVYFYKKEPNFILLFFCTISRDLVIHAYKFQSRDLEKRCLYTLWVLLPLKWHIKIDQKCILMPRNKNLVCLTSLFYKFVSKVLKCVLTTCYTLLCLGRVLWKNYFNIYLFNNTFIVNYSVD